MSAAPDPPIAVGGVADAAEEFRRLKAHISLLEFGSIDKSLEVMLKKKTQCPVPDLADVDCGCSTSMHLVSSDAVPCQR